MITVMIENNNLAINDNQDKDDDNDGGDCDNGACCLSEPCKCFHLGLDGERQTEGTDTSRKRDTRSSAGHHKSEDTSDSREDEAAVSLFHDFFSDSPLWSEYLLQPKHTCPAHPHPLEYETISLSPTQFEV